MRSLGLFVLFVGCWHGSDTPSATTPAERPLSVTSVSPEPAATEAVATREPDPKRGKTIYIRRGCASCHSVDGTTKVGPSWKGIYGATVTLSDGSSVIIDDTYIRQSILEPQSQIVAGFPPAMPSSKDFLADEDIADVIAFIKTLR